MQTFLEDGRVEIDNNDTENDIRPSAVGKKNWLHCRPTGRAQCFVSLESSRF
jgi:hypothetical protein